MIARRPFASYEEYAYQQGAKSRVRRDHLLAHVAKSTQNFARLFRNAAPYLTLGAVLCLGARTGAESIGATQAGFVGSVGIDLHPVGPTVLQADWHALPFPAASFANAFTNSLDHCLDLETFSAEIQRVLTKHGRFYLMATNRHGHTADEWLASGGNEALYWDSSDELRDAVCARGFVVTQEWRDGKWGHYVFRGAR